MSTETANGTQMTLEQFMPTICPEPMSGASARLARGSALQEKEKDLMTTGQVSFERYFAYLTKRIVGGGYRPGWLFYENVTGMLSTNGGFDYLAIQLEMDKRGYDTEWQILDSQWFGVPQHRERVFTIGRAREGRFRKVLPIGNSEEAVETVQGQPVANTLKSSHHIVGTYPTDIVRGGRQVVLKINGFHKE